jgi:hypothetical protein
MGYTKEQERKLLEENLIWLATRTSNARSRGIAIDCLYAHKEVGLTLDNKPLKYALLYEDGMFHVRSYTVRHKHSAWTSVEWRQERVPHTYCTGPRAYHDGRVYRNSFRTDEQPKGSFMCGWSFKPSFRSSILGNKKLSMHERIKIEMTLDMMERVNRVPRNYEDAAEAAASRYDAESPFTVTS